MRRISYGQDDHIKTAFQEADGKVWLSRLFGMTCGNCGEDTGSANAQGLAILSTNLGRFEGNSLAPVEAAFDQGHARFLWTAGDVLRLESQWAFDGGTAVISRRDRLINTGQEAVTVYRCLARFVFPPAHYEVYSQDSRWANENQGSWRPLHASSLVLTCEPGRTTLGGTPYACLREVGSDRGIAFHLLPRGNWLIRFSARDMLGGLPYVVVELGLSDEDLRLVLQPGEAIDLPGILLQALPGGEPHLAAPPFHAFINKHLYSNARPEPPVVYNTWFDRFDLLDVPRLRRQLAAAKEVGCEVFVIDAGWYGPQGRDWYSQAGDWREKADFAFHGQMAAFADEVRTAGLGFGLWMEPERFAPGVPIRQVHPEWFVPTVGSLARIDLHNPQAYAYLRDEIMRLLDTYRLAWIKVDFNFPLGVDASGAELSRYYERWYQLLDEIRPRYPDTFFEGCASGGMRLDLNTLSHFDGHFLSDTVNPIDVLRIYQGALLRLPPGRLTKWAVLRPAKDDITWYGVYEPEKWPVTLLTPCGASWQPSETVDVDFAALAALPGVFGLSGDLAGLPTEAKDRLRWAIRFYKQWRRFITGSSAHLLTPPALIEDRTGWIAYQLQNPVDTTSLLFAYRLADARSRLAFCLRGLDAAASYRVKLEGPREDVEQIMSGKDLMDDGLVIELSDRQRAAVCSIQTGGGA